MKSGRPVVLRTCGFGIRSSIAPSIFCVGGFYFGGSASTKTTRFLLAAENSGGEGAGGLFGLEREREDIYIFVCLEGWDSGFDCVALVNIGRETDRERERALF